MKQVLPKLAMPGVCTRDDDVGNGRDDGCAGVSHDPENSVDGSRGSAAGVACCRCAAGEVVACAWCACLWAWWTEEAGDDGSGGAGGGDGDGVCGEARATEADVGVCGVELEEAVGVGGADDAVGLLLVNEMRCGMGSTDVDPELRDIVFELACHGKQTRTEEGGGGRGRVRASVRVLQRAARISEGEGETDGGEARQS